jgi:hypothetical protein
VPGGVGVLGEEGLLGSMCALFEGHLEDAGDTLMQAHKNGTHTKVGGRELLGCLGPW